MVFSSTPPYLDPHNWHHHQLNTVSNHGDQSGVDIEGDNNNRVQHQTPVYMSPPVPSQSVGGGNTSSIRPGSMADRARQARIPHPEPGLKCPRCQSTNTKFCYFNNYNLTQPRHFCKMCRRYWTKGGALRNVPVGGGFRKNNKRSNNKGGGRVAKTTEEHQDGSIDPNHNELATSPIYSRCNNKTVTNNQNFNHGNMFPLLSSLQSLNQHGQCESPTSNNLGLSFNGMMSGSSTQTELGLQNAAHQWRPNNFHSNFLAAFDPAQYSLRPSSSSSTSSLYHLPIGHQSRNQQAVNNQQLVIRRSTD